jgi:ATP/maltotriose-dependent transcriptional regulator MalT
MQSGSSSAYRGLAGLTSREAEVLSMIADGHSNAGIAAQLYLADKTVKNHITKIYAKLGVASRSDAVSRWRSGPVADRPAG